MSLSRKSVREPSTVSHRKIKLRQKSNIAEGYQRNKNFSSTMKSLNLNKSFKVNRVVRNPKVNYNSNILSQVL